MVTNTNPIFLKTVLTPTLQFIDSDGTATKQVIIAGGDGGAVTQLSATSTDTSDVIMVVSLNDSVNTNVIGEVNVPLGSGTDGTNPAVNLLDSAAITLLQADGSVLLGPGASLVVNPKTAVTATFQIDVTAMGGSYSA